MDTYPEEKHHSQLTVLLLIVLILIIFLICFWFVQNNFFQSKKLNQTTPSNIFSLTIFTPPDQIATSNPNLEISGSTGVSSVVTVQIGSSSQIIRASSGSFSTKVTLSEGKNTISIVAFNPKDGESQTQVRSVLYLNEDLSSL